MAAAEASPSPAPAPTAAESVLIIHNVAKRHNIGTMVRSATAFGVSEMVLEERNCDICGVEIVDGAVPITQQPFRRSTAFLLGNEGTGLSAKECEICDFFVYIPQYGCGTASLNVTVAASIVLHHFGAWAGFAERSRNGNKFSVAERPVKQSRRNFCSESVESIIEERRNRREFGLQDMFHERKADHSQETNLLGELFDS
ncbi:hypothetical protein IEQ34_026499 [Dendrobium chrysotoxum]|uniref:tRNA/rRNA methyltransferase SpoU type domain-containing protein n=1 Tax=Dendrobium chrysotoxum TaxID=161865 RepID=A0AAV7FMB8_DENCH|nr:hypothetical protein IEQ34_026499 [Dendrobium chrysotoxum]